MGQANANHFSGLAYSFLILFLTPQPNLVPPLTNTAAVVAYKAELERIAPEVEWLMTLYLHPEVTPEEIRKAAKAGVRGE